MEEDIHKWVALLQALVRNGQRMAIHVQKLTIRNPTRFNKYYGSDYRDLLTHHQSGVACYDQEVLHDHKLAYFVNALLEGALRRMKNLTDFTWAAENIYPMNSTFKFIKSTLKSFSFHYPYYTQPLTTTWPSEFDPTIPYQKLDSITSLSLSGIPSKHAVKEISGLLVSLRNQLKVLQLGFPDVPWELGSINIWNLYREGRPFMDLADDKLYKDHLFPIIEELIELNEPIKLHTLEVDYIMQFDVNHWSKAFDFNTIEKFSLTHTHNNSTRSLSADLAPEMWSYFRENGITFKSFKTSCDSHDKELLKYLSSFEGLEELYLCSIHFSPTFLDLQGHFHSLRVLFCAHWQCVEYDPVTFLAQLIEGTPNLEELAINIHRPYQELYFSVFSQSRSLKRLYIVNYKKMWMYDGSFKNPRTYDRFIRSFFNYYRDNPCPFFDRLERLSCFRTLWELVPIDLTREEQKEMKYELEPDPDLAPFLFFSEEKGVKQSDLPPPREAVEGFDLLLEPYCYSWERALSGFEKMPMRVDWDDYWEDEMASTVYDYIMLPFFGEVFDRQMSDWNEQVVINGYSRENEEDDQIPSADGSSANDDESEAGGGDGDSGSGSSDGGSDGSTDGRGEDGEGQAGNGDEDDASEDAGQHTTGSNKGVKPKNILPIYGVKEGEHEDFA